MSERRLSKREVGLLLESHVANEDYPWLIDKLKFGRIFIPGNAGLNTTELEIYSSNIENIITTAKSEWKLREKDTCLDVEDDRTNCKICNQSNTRYLYFIENQITNKELNVGSDCIEYFGIAKKRTLEELKQEVRISKQRARIAAHIPDIAQKAENWPSEIKKMPVVIPQADVEPFFKITEEIKSLYDQYICLTEEPSEEFIDQLKDFIFEGEKILLNIKQIYATSNIVDPYIVTRRTYNWIKNSASENDRNFIIAEIEKTGKIKPEHICRVITPEFMRNLMPVINKKFENSEIEFTTLDSNSSGHGRYIVKFEEPFEVFLSCGHRKIFSDPDFLDSIILNKKTMEYKHILKTIVQSSYAASAKEHPKILMRLIEKFKTLITLRNIDIDRGFPEMLLCNEQEKKYTLVEEVKIVSVLLPFALDLIEEKKACEIINTLNPKWITWSDIKDLQERYPSKK